MNARRGHFIPIDPRALLAVLRRLEPMSDAEAERFNTVIGLIEQRIHAEFQRRVRRLCEIYARFDPDVDVVPLPPSDTATRERLAAELFVGMGYLLEKANFRRLDRSDVQQAVRAMGALGASLAVNIEAFSRLDVYARGHHVDTRQRRRWQNWFRREVLHVPLYKRLAVAFRPHDDHRLPGHFNADTIYLRYFKNIPEMDVDMVLPGTRVKMSTLDHAMIAMPTFTGLFVTGLKIVKGALLVAAVGFYGLLAYVGLVIGTLGYGYRSFFGYVRTREKYQLNLTQSLYYQNLDNNLGVIYRAAAEAEDQEFREAVTAYYLLWRRAGPEGWTLEELDQQAEAMLREHVRGDVDFEASDAVEKLRNWELLEVRGDGRLAVG